jgi:hypothetical protein
MIMGKTMRSRLIRASLLSVLVSSTAAAQRDTVFRWSKALPAGSRFAIRNFNGLVDVQPGKSDRVEVLATIRTEPRGIASDVKFDVRDQAADSAEICTVFRGVNACDPDESDDSWSDRAASVAYSVQIPKGLRLSIVTHNGDVIVMQTVAEIDVNSGNGDVVVRESESRAVATSGNGDVTVAFANGAVRASSGNGSVMVNAAGPINASSGNGDVDARIAPLNSSLDTRPMTLSSGNGNVRLSLPADFNGQIDATASHGRIKSDFDVRARGSVERSRLRGSIGTGNGPLIKLNSGNGRLEIRKG